jgi:maltose alpha-D-glucosyltransferase/alpha-amylase
MPSLVTLSTRGRDAPGVLTGDCLHRLEREVLREFLPLQRWFGAKGERFLSSELRVGPSLAGHALGLAEVRTQDSGAQCYFLPLGVLWGEDNTRFGAPHLSATLAKVRRANRVGVLVDGTRLPDFAEAMVRAMREGARDEAHGLTLVCEGTKALSELESVDEARALGVEQSNVSIAFGDKGLLKVYRRLRPGRQPDIEIGRFLTEETDFANTPAFMGEATIQWEGAEPATVAACFAFVPNEGDGWGAVVDALARELQDRSVATEAEEAATLEEAEEFPYPLGLMGLLGRRTAELHRALATPTEDPSFGTAPVAEADVAAWTADVREQATEAFRLLSGAPRSVEGDMLIERRDRVFALIERLGGASPAGVKSRVHGDYHLGQVLLAHADFQIIDFEGEPRRSLEERREKSSPLRDVAGMLRSFDYAAFAAIDRARSLLGDGGAVHDEIAWRWRDAAAAAFRREYGSMMAGSEDSPEGPEAEALLDLLILQKALYEIGYEATNRPAWLSIPVRGVLRLLDAREAG